MLIDEYKEYDELDDGIQYHRYCLIMDNNHIYKFLILEPEEEEEMKRNEKLISTVNELCI
jgi:hypothetical protein